MKITYLYEYLIASQIPSLDIIGSKPIISRILERRRKEFPKAKTEIPKTSMRKRIPTVTEIIILTSHAVLNDILAKYQSFSHMNETATASIGILLRSSHLAKSEITINEFKASVTTSATFQKLTK